MGLPVVQPFVRTDRLDDFGVHAPVPLQEPEADAFPRRRAPRWPFRGQPN